MIFNIRGETFLLLLRSFLAGAVLGAVYDILRTAVSPSRDDERGLRGVRRVAVLIISAVFDIIFCILGGVTALLLMYYSNRGFFRASVLAVMLLGFLCFRCSLGIIFRRVLSWLYGIIWRVICFAFRPLKFIFLKLFSLFHLTICKFVGRIVAGAESVRAAAMSRGRRNDEAAEAIERGELSDVTDTEGGAGSGEPSGAGSRGSGRAGSGEPSRAYRAYGRIRF